MKWIVVGGRFQRNGSCLAIVQDSRLSKARRLDLAVIETTTIDTLSSTQHHRDIDGLESDEMDRRLEDVISFSVIDA